MTDDRARYLELREAVRAMREAQRDYFRERTPEKLNRAKHLERLVDELCRDDRPVPSPDLFSGPDAEG